MSTEDSTLLQKVAEEEAAKEESKPELESAAVEVPKATEEPPKVTEEKQPPTETKISSVTEIPPPLPSSPPPVETPVEPTPTIVETSAPVQPEKPEVEQAEPEDETVGGGEGLAEPPEDLNTSDIEKEVAKEVAEVPLVNGNHVEEEKLVSSPDVTSLADKIEAIKLSNAADISEVTNELTNGSHEVNGVSDAVATSDGTAGGD